MAEMTEEEAWALDEKWTKNPPDTGPNGTGFLSRLKAEGKPLHFVDEDHVVILDDLSSAYLNDKARTTHKTPSQIIGEWAREHIEAQAVG